MSYEKNPDGTYVDLEYTKFPAVVDSWQNHTDVTTSTLSAANQYRIAIQNGNLINAQALLNNYPDLRKTIITADDINKIKQAVMALERYYTDDVQSYIISYSNTASNSAKSAQKSMKNAENSETIAKEKAEEINQLLEKFKSLANSLPSDFSEYVNDFNTIKNEFGAVKEDISAKIDKHNTNSTAHQDIRNELKNHTHTLNDIVGSGTLPIANGGTGASTASMACSNIGALSISGGTMTGNVYFGNTNYYIKSDGSAKFNRAYGAVYNDYAEYFPRGEKTEPGDIIALDTTSNKERYVKASTNYPYTVGVHTDEYAMLIGGDHLNSDIVSSDNEERYIPVSLAGRVMTKVIGEVCTGDLITVSEYPGIGRAVRFDENVPQNQIVGYAVENDNRKDLRRIRVRIGR